MSVSNLHNIFVIKNEESGMPSDMSILSVCGVAAAAMAHWPIVVPAWAGLLGPA